MQNYNQTLKIDGLNQKYMTDHSTSDYHNYLFTEIKNGLLCALFKILLIEYTMLISKTMGNKENV